MIYQAPCEGWTCGDLFGEAVESAIVFQVWLVDGKQGAAQQGQGTYDIGIAASCVIFTQAGVFSPMMAVFRPRPVAADVVQPLFRGMRLSLTVGDVVAVVFEVLAVPPAGVKDSQGASSMGEVDLQRVEFDEAYRPAFQASVGFLGDGKRGEAAVVAARRLCTVGWFFLTCRR